MPFEVRRKSPNFSTLKRYSKKSLENNKKTIDNHIPKCYTIIKEREVVNMMKWFGRIVVMLEVVFLLWLFVSWVDIIADNTQPNPQHSQYNAFVMMVENFEEKN